MWRISFIGAVAVALMAGVRVALTQQPVVTISAAQSAPTNEGSEAPDRKRRDESLQREDVTALLRENRKIVSERGIEEATLVEIGAIKQAISIRGRDTRNPILMIVHGGPASPEMPHAYTFQSPWEDYFTVVE